MTRAAPTPWEVSLLRRIESAVYPKLLKKPGESDAGSAARVDDPRAMSSVLAGLRARANAAFK